MYMHVCAVCVSAQMGMHVWRPEGNLGITEVSLFLFFDRGSPWPGQELTGRLADH